ncbi:MAG: hypothetical protein ACFFCZ_19780 [Promethearchaeota archaeon]
MNWINSFSAKPSHVHKLMLISLIAVIVFSTLFIPWVSNNDAMDSCTIFSVSRDGRTFFCDNEDEGLRHGRIWFLPGIGNQYGLVLFCYGIYRNVMIPVGGMNDQGLCLDGTIVPETQIRLDPNKPDYVGTFTLDMLRVCATVEEARLWVRSNDLLMLHWQQVHIADKTGDVVVVGLDNIGDLWLTNSSEDYLISVPVNHAQNSHGFGDRYTTVEAMLNTMSELTLEGCREILRTVSVPETMFSYICDQQNGILYLYSRGDFDRVAILNVTAELEKGEHSYDIEKLISQQTGQSSSPDTLGTTTGIVMIGGIIIFSLVITIVKLRVKKNTNCLKKD